MTVAKEISYDELRERAKRLVKGKKGEKFTSQQEIADEFGLTRIQVHRVLNGEQANAYLLKFAIHYTLAQKFKEQFERAKTLEDVEKAA